MGFLMSQRKSSSDQSKDDALSFSLALICCLFPHMVNVVTRSSLCLGKARVRPDRAQRQGPAIHLRALDPWNLCLRTTLVWWEASLQEAELQGHGRVAGESFDGQHDAQGPKVSFVQ